MKRKFQDKVIIKMEPVQYRKYLEKQQVASTSSSLKGHFSDNKYHLSKIYCEKVNNDFWVVALETEEKSDTCYHFHPKISSSNFFSINYFFSDRVFGVTFGERIDWVKNISVLISPNTSYKVFVRENSTTNFFRLVFSKRSLQKIFSLSDLDELLRQADYGVDVGRLMTQPETMAIEKLKYLFNYGRSSLSYKLALNANVFNIADLFFGVSFATLSSVEKPILFNEKIFKIAEYLQGHIHDDFPGISTLAANFFISETSLKKHFKAIYNTTPLVYFRRLQMIYAVDVLARNAATVKQLSLQMGFKKPSTFSTWFKWYTGTLPSDKQI